MERCPRVVADDPGLRSHPEDPDEYVPGLCGTLQVHDAAARLLVRRLQLVGVVDPAHPHPGASVVRLHEEGVAELLANLTKIEQPGVALQSRLQVGGGLVLLGRDHPGVGHGQAEPHHRHVRAVFLHRLEGPRVVEDVQPVHEHGLLDPLPADLVPVGEPVEHDVVPRVLSQVEGLDRDPLHLDPVRLAFVGDGPEAVDDPLETRRPAEVRPQRQPDDPGGVRHDDRLRETDPRCGRTTRRSARAGRETGRTVPVSSCRASSPSCARRGPR